MTSALRRLGKLAIVLCLSAGVATGTWWAYSHGKLQTALATFQTAVLERRAGESDAAKAAARLSERRGTGSQSSIAVEVAQARSAKRSNDIRAIGSLQSDESVQLAPEIAGRISEILFKEGQTVKTGDVLVKLDQSLAEAEVTDTKARLTLAVANNERARALSKTGAVTGKSRDEAVAAFETAQAAVALAATRLSKHVLSAPFDGVAGVRAISVGAFVNAGTPIVNIEKIDSLKVDFKVPETALKALKPGQKIEVQVDAIVGETFEGEIYVINPLVDVNGRALQVRARLDNKELQLRPGLFARILIKGLEEREIVLVPESAVLPKGGESFVFLVDNGKAVEKRVKLGQRSNAEVEILEGLNVSATVVTAGQQKLRDGAIVEVIASEPGATQSETIGRAPRTTTGSSAGRSG